MLSPGWLEGGLKRRQTAEIGNNEAKADIQAKP